MYGLSNPNCRGSLEVRGDFDTYAVIVYCKNLKGHTDPHRSYLPGGNEIMWRDALNPYEEEVNG